MTLWTAIPLVFIAASSPIFTLLRLWQVKEWRLDRLREHLAHENWFKQAYGWVRPAVLAAWILLNGAVYLFSGFNAPAVNQRASVLRLTLATLTCIQIGFKKQHLPIWSAKAMSLAGICGALVISATIVFGFVVNEPLRNILISVLPFLAPFFVGVAWIMLKPVDVLLKKRIINRAIAVRRAHPRVIVIGVTGSVGKTTTKELLANVLKPLDAISTPAHLNTEIGVARWLTGNLKNFPPDKPLIIIVEMGAYRAGEIELLAKITQPQIGIVTYIGEQHLSLFGSREAIRQAKGELLLALPENGHAFLNSDNEAFAELKKMCRSPVTAIGTDGHADMTAFDIEETERGLKFRALETAFEVPIAGTHNITSVLFSIAVGRHLNIPINDIARSLKNFSPLRHTFEIQNIRGVTVLDDTYNLSPMSFRAALKWARRQPHTKKILLTGGIIELGNQEEKIHLELAREAADIFDQTYILSPRFLKYFREGGFGDRAKPAIDAKKIEAGVLLVCSGRLPRSLIDKFLPSS